MTFNIFPFRYLESYEEHGADQQLVQPEEEAHLSQDEGGI
jgi:hypothetical protein